MTVITDNLADAERNIIGHIIAHKNHYILIVSCNTGRYRHQAICIYIHVILPYHGVGMRFEFRYTELLLVLFPSIVLDLDGNINKFLGNVAHLFPQLFISHCRVWQGQLGTDVVIEEFLELCIISCSIAGIQLRIGC